jgi:hypothetical protein
MTRYDQELLGKQLWGVSSRSPQSGIITDDHRGVFSRLGRRRYSF